MYAARPAHPGARPAGELGSSSTSISRRRCCPTTSPSIRRSTADWNVVYDARGNFTEPHTGKRVPLGTLQVREYLAEIGEHDGRAARVRHLGAALPDHRAAAPLRRDPVHRERGLQPAVRGGAARRALRPRDHVDQGHERHREPASWSSRCAASACRSWCCTISTSPASRSSARCGAARAGYRFGRGHAARVIDLGLRLEDVDGLETEAVGYGTADRAKARANLRENGATPRRSSSCLRAARRAERLRVARPDRLARGQARGARHRQGGARTRPTLADAWRRMASRRWSRRGSTRCWPSSMPTPARTVPEGLQRPDRASFRRPTPP